LFVKFIIEQDELCRKQKFFTVYKVILSGKSQIVQEFDSCWENVEKFTKSQGKARKSAEKKSSDWHCASV